MSFVISCKFVSYLVSFVIKTTCLISIWFPETLIDCGFYLGARFYGDPVLSFVNYFFSKCYFVGRTFFLIFFSQETLTRKFLSLFKVS